MIRTFFVAPETTAPHPQLTHAGHAALVRLGSLSMPGGGQWHALMPIAFAGIVVWSLWLYRFVLSRLAGPITTGFATTTSVVVPSYHEDPDILMQCLATWRAQHPTEIIVVLDVADTECFDRVSSLGDATIRPVLFKHAGKRSALGVGIRMATSEVLVLTDSDTLWTPGLLSAVQEPFADAEVGAVGTQQNVYERETSVWRRVADWLVNVRYYDYVPAMGRAGAVACVSGRTAAYRRDVVLPVLENMENEFFLGKRCVSGDDGRLTWLVLASGYKTVHQSKARAVSMFPASFRAFVKQRVRWSRNSYRCYLTAIHKGWLWRVPLVTKVTVLQFLLTPLTMGITLGYLVFSRLEASSVSVITALAWLLVSRAIRGVSHLRRHPFEILLLPLVVVVVIFVALPVKLYALLTMNKQGWLTRSASTIGGESQDAASLVDRDGASPLDQPGSRPAPAPAPAPATTWARTPMPARVPSPAAGRHRAEQASR